jgi:type I restriction enzyme R subunit
MEHAIRSHIRKHLDQDPVAYRKLSDRLRDLLDQLGEQWDEALVDKLMELARANHDRLRKV